MGDRYDGVHVEIPSLDNYTSQHDAPNLSVGNWLTPRKDGDFPPNIMFGVQLHWRENGDRRKQSVAVDGAKP